MALFNLLFLGVTAAWLLFLVFVIINNSKSVKRVVTPELFVSLLGRTSMSDVLTYVVSAGPVVDHDVVARELSAVVDGVAQPVAVFPGTATELGSVTVPQNASVVLVLVDIDDAGNRSAPATVEFVAVDTIPPAQPGSFGVTLVAEAPAPADEVVTPEESTDETDA
jgi:hypothetical protein